MSRIRLVAQNLNASDPAVRACLSAGDADWLRRTARRIATTGVDLVDCNAGTFGRDEAALLGWMAEQVAPLVGRPLSLDSADPEVLVAVASTRRGPLLLNSLPVDFDASPELRAVLADPEREVVLSLRRASGLPPDAATRRAWALEGLGRLEAMGVDPSRVLVDAIALPFGDDVDAGRVVLDFVEDWARSGNRAGTLVGLGNFGHGHPEAVRIHREWLVRLRDAGIDAALVDAFEPGLRALVAPGA